MEASHSKYLRFARRSPRAELPPLDSPRAPGASPRGEQQCVPRSMLRAIRSYQRGLVDQRTDMFAPTSFTSEASKPATASLKIARAFGKAPPARSIFAQLAAATADGRGHPPSVEFAAAGLTVERVVVPAATG